MEALRTKSRSKAMLAVLMAVLALVLSLFMGKGVNSAWADGLDTISVNMNGVTQIQIIGADVVSNEINGNTVNVVLDSSVENGSTITAKFTGTCRFLNKSQTFQPNNPGQMTQNTQASPYSANVTIADKAGSVTVYTYKAFPADAVAGGVPVTVNFTVAEDQHAPKTNVNVTSITVSGHEAGKLSDTIYAVTLPEGSPLPANESAFAVVTEDPDASAINFTTTDNGATWTFVVDSADSSTQATYTVYVDIAGSLAGDYLGVQTQPKVYENWEHGIWLNAQQVKLNVGDVWQFWPKRVPFIGNDGGWVHPAVVYPEFDIEKIYESSTGSIDMVSHTNVHSYDNAYNGRVCDINYSGYVVKDSEGNLVNDITYPVTALRPGTTIVKVTYRAYDLANFTTDVPSFTVSNGRWSPYQPTGEFPATPDVNTAYMVFTVGETGTATITSSIDNWRRYDTVYYSSGRTVDYNITAEASGAESFVVTCNGIVVEANDDGTYTLPLENRDNIVGMIATDANGNTTSTYRIIAARYIEITATNKNDPDKPVMAGEPTTVMFNGVTLPLNRIMGFYNPQYSAAGYNNQPAGINYTNSYLGSFTAQKGQWTLKDATFDVTFDTPGTYEFTGSNISLKWWGAPLGSDLLQPKDYNPSTSGSSPEEGGSFSQGMLPSFSVDVLAKPVVTTTELKANEGKAIDLQLEATGRPDSFTWHLSDGSTLPGDLQLSNDGKLTGSALDEGTYTFSVDVYNTTGRATAEITLSVMSKFEKPEGIVYATITDNFGFFKSNGEIGGVTMWRVPIDLAELSEIDLDEVTIDGGTLGLGELKYDEDGNGSYDITALQLLVYLSDKYYTGGVDSFVPVGYPTSGHFFVASFFGGDSKITYSLNDTAPIDEAISQEEDETIGKTCDRYVLSDGDHFVFHMQAYEGETTNAAPGNFFIEAGSNASEQGNLVYEYAGKAGEPISVQLKRAYLGQGDYGMVYMPYADKTTLKYAKDAYDAESSLRLDNLTFDENGATTITFSEPGTYYVWTDDRSPAMAKITVTQDAAISISEEVSADGVALPDAEVGEAYSVPIGIIGYPTPEVTVTGLPEGLGFDDETNTISGTPTESGSFTVGITAVNEGATAEKELTLKVGNFAAELSEAKAAAIAELNETFNPDNYSGEERDAVEAALADAEAAINEAETLEAVESAKETAAQALAAIKTDAQKEAEAAAQALADAKAQAISYLNATYAPSLYSGEEVGLVESALASAAENINAAETVEAVESAKAAAVEVLGAIKTDAQKAAEAAAQALADAKAAAIEALTGAFDPANYSGDEKAAVEAALADAETAINEAETLEAVESAKETAAQALASIKTDAQKAADAAQALADAKAAAIAELNETFNPDNYSGDDKVAVEAALAEAVAAINAAETIDVVSNAKAAAKTALSAAKTDADKAAEQADQKTTKTTKIAKAAKKANLKANPIQVKAKKVKAKASKLSKKTLRIKAKKAFKVTGAAGKVSYKIVKISGKKKLVKKAAKKIKLSAAGKLTLKKGLKKGKYKVKVAITADGGNAFKPATKIVTLKVVVK